MKKIISFVLVAVMLMSTLALLPVSATTEETPKTVEFSKKNQTVADLSSSGWGRWQIANDKAPAARMDTTLEAVVVDIVPTSTADKGKLEIDNRWNFETKREDSVNLNYAKYIVFEVYANSDAALATAVVSVTIDGVTMTSNAINTYSVSQQHNDSDGKNQGNWYWVLIELDNTLVTRIENGAAPDEDGETYAITGMKFQFTNANPAAGKTAVYGIRHIHFSDISYTPSAQDEPLVSAPVINPDAARTTVQFSPAEGFSASSINSGDYDIGEAYSHGTGMGEWPKKPGNHDVRVDTSLRAPVIDLRQDSSAEKILLRYTKRYNISIEKTPDLKDARWVVFEVYTSEGVDLSKATVEVTLYSGVNDWYADATTVNATIGVYGETEAVVGGVWNRVAVQIPNTILQRITEGTFAPIVMDFTFNGVIPTSETPNTVGVRNIYFTNLEPERTGGVTQKPVGEYIVSDGNALNDLNGSWNMVYKEGDSSNEHSVIPAVIANPDKTGSVIHDNVIGAVYNGTLVLGNKGTFDEGDITLTYCFSSAKAIDVSMYDYFIFDLYVSDAAALTDAIFTYELSSAGIHDKNESSVRQTSLPVVTGTVLVDGWNKIKIKMDRFTRDASLAESDAGLNSAAWNYFRFYFDQGSTELSNVTIAVANLGFANYKAEVPDTPQSPTISEAAQAVIDAFEGIRDITVVEQITAENYNSIRIQYNNANQLWTTADAATKAELEGVLDADSILLTVRELISLYNEANKELEGGASASPDEPAETDPIESESTETETQAESVDSGSNKTLIIVCCAVGGAVVVAAVVGICIGLKKKGKAVKSNENGESHESK